MTICETIRNCHISTFRNYNGTLISVGMYVKGADRFITLCIQDRVSCQHIITQHYGLFVLLEKAAIALLMGADPGV